MRRPVGKGGTSDEDEGGEDACHEVKHVLKQLARSKAGKDTKSTE